MGFLVSTLAGIIPMFIYAWLLYFLDRYEKEPLHLLFGTFGWGAIVAAGGAFIINNMMGLGIYQITQSEYATQLTLSTLIAPGVEETLKGVAVLIVFLFFRAEFDSLLDGVIYGGITALGFAATENIWYIHNLGYLQNSWQGLLDLTLIRSVLFGWQHPFYTAFIGLGFAVSRRSTQKIWILITPLIGWLIAVTFHLLHNLFAGLLHSKAGVIFSIIWDWSGYLGLLVLILLLIKREQFWMKKYLVAEIDQQFISLTHYQTACSAWRQSLALLQGRIQGKFRDTSLFYQACGNLMHKKRQLAHLGDELGTALEIQRLRSELKELALKI